MDALLAAIAAHGDTLGIGALLVTVLGVLFRGLATGRIVFRSQVDAEITRTVTYYDKLIDLKDEQIESWRTAYQNEATARGDQGHTLSELQEYAVAADHMLRALPKVPADSREPKESS